MLGEDFSCAGGVDLSAAGVLWGRASASVDNSAHATIGPKDFATPKRGIELIRFCAPRSKEVTLPALNKFLSAACSPCDRCIRANKPGARASRVLASPLLFCQLRIQTVGDLGPSF